jgi:hypothetical protein
MSSPHIWAQYIVIQKSDIKKKIALWFCLVRKIDTILFITCEQESTDDNVLMFQGAITLFTGRYCENEPFVERS